MTLLTKVVRVGKPDVSGYQRTIPCTNPNLVIGLELETENCQYKVAGTWVEGAASRNFRVERDGSLRGVAYEFISQPMRSEHALAALQDFLAWGEFTPENYTDRTSVHVHVNCTDMELEQISSLALLYTVAEEILFEFVGGHRESNIYCIPWSHCRAHYDLVQNFLANPTGQLKKWNKYTALNLIPLASYGTVEFRQMHGTADFPKLERWINMIGSLVAMAKATPLEGLVEEIKTLNTTSQYDAFFQRMFNGTLTYDDRYRQRLEEGVIFAKYSLITMGRAKRKAAAPTPMDDAEFDRMLGRLGDMPVREAAPRPTIRPTEAQMQQAAIQQAMDNLRRQYVHIDLMNTQQVATTGIAQAPAALRGVEPAAWRAPNLH